MDGQTIGVAVAAVSAVASAVSAIASAVSAYSSRQAVERSHRPFVWPAISHRYEDGGRHILRVRLHNDAPGTAYDVRWSVGSVDADERDRIVEDRRLTERNTSLVMRALRPGEMWPAVEDEWLERAVALPEDDVWWVLVRWTDSSGTRWERAELGPSLLRTKTRRVRGWKWRVWHQAGNW